MTFNEAEDKYPEYRNALINVRESIIAMYMHRYGRITHLEVSLLYGQLEYPPGMKNELDKAFRFVFSFPHIKRKSFFFLIFDLE